MIVEVLSPSNTSAKVNRQRIVAMSAGTQEFWVVDAEKRTVEIMYMGGSKRYASGEAIPLRLFGNPILAVDRIFSA